jgi:hypothetical protein
VDHALQQVSSEILACQFLKKYFFLLDLKRAKESIKLSYAKSPCVWETFIKGLKGNNQTALSKMGINIENSKILEFGGLKKIK